MSAPDTEKNIKSLVDTIDTTEDVVQQAPSPGAETDFVDQELDHEIKRAYIETLQSNNIQRKRYAINTFILTCGWIGIVICIVVLTGLKALSLSDTVLITLITTTTASVFGFFLLVMKYLFNTGLEKPKTANGTAA